MATINKPKILVVGAGAVGGFYGGKLAQAGADVSVICRSDYQVVAEQGFEIQSCWGDFRFNPTRVLNCVDEYDDYPDYLIVALKALPELDLPDLISGVVGPKTSVVLLQNGINVESLTAERFPNSEIISGLAFICVNRLGPGKIHHMDYGRLALGRYPYGKSTAAEDIAELFKQSGVPCSISEDIITERWKKLVWNVPFNCISVLGGGLDTRAILGTPDSVEFVRKVMVEVCAVAVATGHPLDLEVIDRNINDTIAMKPYRTSMLLDSEAGRPMEIEAIVGNVVRIAEGYGIDTPRINCLYSLLSLHCR